MSPETHFSDPAAVDAWDGWFRWREDGFLRDLTIDATWHRVADCIARVEGVHAPAWTQRFIDAFSQWRLLPDPRLLQSAGTTAASAPVKRASTVVNAAAFVSLPRTAAASFDHEKFVESVGLAVRLLDNIRNCGCSEPGSSGLRLGLIGMADAMNQLGHRYESASARKFATELATAFSEGALQGAIGLARERGEAQTDRKALARLWRARGVSPSLLNDLLRSGVRHTRITVIERQPRLALFANNTSDAIDPQLPDRQQKAESQVLAQVELRAAMQPWIDELIDYPLLAASEPSAATMESLQALARGHGLRPITVRRPGDEATIQELED